MNLEDELRAALRREEPSLGFAERVVARAQAPRRANPIRPRFAWALAMAAMLAILIGVTADLRQKKAERAGRDAVIALRIAAEKLNATRAKALRRVDN